MVDLFEIGYIGVPLLFLILERPFKLVSKVRDRLDGLWVLKEGFSIYNLLSFFLLMGVWLYFLAPLPQLLSRGNIFIELYTDGHWASWIGIMVAVTYFGYFDIIRGVYVGGFLYSVHELAWITVAGVFYNELGFIYIHYAPIVVLMAILLTSYFLAYRGLPKYKEILIVTVIVVFDLLWAVAGFNVTVTNWVSPPTTIYFTDPVVNVVEVLSWVLPALVALL